MRIIEGFEQGMALLDRRAGFEEPVLSAGAARRTAEVFGQPLSASESVRRILAEVRSRGDDAVREFARKFDGATLGEIEVPRERWAEALRSLPSGLEDALRVAASRIRAYAEASMPKGWRDDDAGFGEAIAAIERVGLYVPGGTAAYPSTVLMAGIPARVAGVREIVLCTPMPNAVTLAAAYVAGVDRVFGIGGAQAIGAMAYGTANVPKVDKICGPGNIFVSIAKREVYGSVDIDGMYGPTETVVIADDSPDPALAAADLLAQAEHDEMASPVLITTSRAMAEKVIAAGKEQVARLERAAIAGASMERNAVAVVVRTVEEAVELANAFAPEHLCLLVDEPWRYVPLVRNAGGVFVGEHSPEVMGDYVAGPSHVMPTSGTARFASALSVHAFIKHVPVVALSGDTMRRLGPSASAIARAEGLTAHARAVELRLEGGR